MNRIVMDLQFFADEGAAAAAAPENAGGGGTEAAVSAQAGPIQAGDTLPNGQQVQSAQVAAELERQMKRHPELRQVYGQKPQAQEKTGQAPAQPQEDTIQARWDALKKGEFKELYGQDIKNTIQERFKNQRDAQAQLDGMQPMLNALMQKAGVKTVEELQQLVMDDDSLYEEAAENAGMTVEAYKHMQALEAEHEQHEAMMQQQKYEAHFANLAQQAEALKQEFPDFDLEKEMENPKFFQLTRPELGYSLKQAYYAVHGEELTPQLMAYGMQRAREQMSQTIQAQGARPAEGPARGQGSTAASMAVDFSKMTRKERDEYRQAVLSGRVKGGRFA